MTKRGEVLIFFKDWSAKKLASLPFLYHLMAEVCKKGVPPWKPGNWERAIDESHRAPDLRQAHPILQTTLWQRTRYPQQTTASWLRFFFRGKTGAETERIRRGANNHHVTLVYIGTWFQNFLNSNFGYNKDSVNKDWRTHSKEQLSSTGVLESTHRRISYVYFCGSKKTARWNQLKYRAVRAIKNIYTRHTYCWLLMDQILPHFIWYNWLTSAFSNHLNTSRFFKYVFLNQKFNGLKRWWAK